MKKQSRSFEIALSALSCALALLALGLAAAEPLLGLGYIIAVFALMIPLSKDLIWGNVVTYLATCLLSMLWLWGKVIPFAVFFGLHPLVNYLQKRFVKRTPLKVVCLAAKTVWFDLSILLSYFVLSKVAGFTFPELVTRYLPLVIALGCTLFFVVYDVMIFYCQRSVNLLVRRIRR